MTQTRRSFTGKAVVAAASLALATTARAGAQTPETSPVASPFGEALAIKVGATPVPHAEILQFVKDELAAQANLSIEIAEVTDYVLPNTALDEGELDANYFQHLPYLNDFNAEHGTDLAPVVAIHIEPLGIYSSTLTSLDDVESGAVVGIPNDVTNGGRALKLIEASGLITLDPEIDNPTVADITDNPKNLDFAELEAAQLPRSLEDTDISVINGNYALEAGLTPSEDALALESGENNPYANYLVVAAGHEEDPNVQALAALLTSPDVKTFIEETYQGSVLPAF